MAVRDALLARGVRVHFLAQERCFEDWSLDYLDHAPVIQTDDLRLAARDIGAVFWRQDYSCTDVMIHTAERDVGRFVAEQRERHAYGCWATLESSIPFINSLRAHRTAQSKSHQHYIAKRLGLRVPATYVGTSPSIAEDFARGLWATGRRCCTKNIEATRFTLAGRPHARFTQVFEPHDIDQLRTLHFCPMIFQEYIEKKWEYRVTVVGTQVYACRIDSQAAGGDTAVDWRHYDLPRTPHRACSLPSELTSTLVNLLRALGLCFGAFDLVHSTDDEVVFLEVNSLGSWLWIEDLVGFPITETLASLLMKMASDNLSQVAQAS